MAQRRPPKDNRKRGGIAQRRKTETSGQSSRRAIQPFTAALESAAKHTRSHERRSRAAKRGWEKRRYREAHGPPKAIAVQDVAREFDDAQRAVDFARRNLVPPWEWADDLADEFDLDIHELYEAYYDTDPATQSALA